MGRFIDVILQGMIFRIVVLAAGKGKRMKQPFPKALTPVAGKPILQYLVESVEASKVDGPPVVVVGPERPKLCETFGVTCTYAVQQEQLGTGHAVLSAKEAVGKADALIVLYGDHPFLSADSLQRLAKRHEERGNVVTMMTTVVPNFNGWYTAFSHWGRILRGSDGHIIGIREDKDATEEERKIQEVNPALFCFDAKWLWKHIETLKNENVQKEYYLTDLIAMAVSQGQKISSLEIAPEEAVGINTPEECRLAEDLIKNRYS